MEADLTLEELQTTMESKGMKDTAPGSDGIPYPVYGKLWTMAGPLVLDAWNYLCASILILCNISII